MPMKPMMPMPTRPIYKINRPPKRLLSVAQNNDYVSSLEGMVM